MSEADTFLVLKQNQAIQEIVDLIDREFHNDMSSILSVISSIVLTFSGLTTNRERFVIAVFHTVGERLIDVINEDDKTLQ